MSKLAQLRKGESGQATLLGAISFIIIAFSLFATFNISQTVHERIRIQQYADTQAYSIATETARAFNYFAYTNRAMVSA